ncbi:MAG: DUF1573 domain-containing protein [Planctomycetota bacterium]|nr:DUF1573 domain-containing protein [Planctomycetota bacterium]MDA1177278.1 DUF1573 domain-containing protein [Planctomycetota bacterium]
MDVKNFRLFVVGITCAALLGIGTLRLTSPWKKVAPLVCDAHTQDFGIVGSGELLRHQFDVYNSTNKTIDIRSVRADCGCVVPTISKRRLTPGERTWVNVTLNTGGLSAPVDITRRMAVEFSSNDQESTEILPLTVQATIVKDVDAIVDTNNWAIDPAAATLTTTIRVVSQLLTESEAAGIQMESSAPWQVRRVPRKESNSEEPNVTLFEIAARRSDVPRYPQPLELRYSRKGTFKSMLIPIDVVPEMSAVVLEPRVVAMKVVSGDSGKSLRNSTTRNLQLVVNDGLSHRIDSVELQGIPGAKCRWAFAGEDRSRCEVWLEQVPVIESSAVGQLVVVHTNSSGGRETVHANAVLLRN